MNLIDIDKTKSRFIDGLRRAKKTEEFTFNYDIEFLEDTGASVSIISLGAWKVL